MSAVSVASLHLPEEARAHIVSHAEAAYPGECCGLLVGLLSGESYEVRRAESCRNLREGDANDRFEVDPKDFLAVDKRARADGLEVIGVYHSHPDHAPRPSRFDAAVAFPGFAYIIVAVRSGREAGMRSWLMGTDGVFLEQDISCP